MKHEVSYQVQGERAIVLERARAYLECVGYRFMQEGEELVFQRGSIFGSMVGFSPANWLATIHARIVQTPNRNMKATFTFDVNTVVQQVSQPEADYWNFEIYGLERAVMAGADFSAAAREVALEAELNNWRVLARLVLIPLVFIPFIIAFVAGIDPLAGYLRGLSQQIGQLPVVGMVTAILLMSAGGGMFWLPTRINTRRSPAALLAGTVVQTAYYAVFGLLVVTSLCLLTALERSVWVVMCLALGGVVAAVAADRARKR